MSGILEDDRVQWLRQRVVLSLDISPESFDDHFKESIDNFKAAEQAKTDLSSFLSSENGAGTSLFFSSQTWTEDITGTFY